MKSKIFQKIEYPQITPIPEGVHRPFWSVMIPTYNCANYLVQTLESVLAQDPGSEHMQIEVVDDCSTKDDSEAVVREIGKGRVSFYRQPQNVGAIRNFNTCIQRSVGQFVHILHGDDFVAPDFYSSYAELLQSHPDATLIISPSISVDENNQHIHVASPLANIDGIITEFAEIQALRNEIHTPTAVVPRKVYEHSGGYYLPLSHTADWEMFFRAGLHGKAVTLDKQVAYYRIHSGSDTSRLALTGKNIWEAKYTVDMCMQQLPEKVRREIDNNRYSYIAGLAHYFYSELANKEMWKSSLIHAGWHLKLSPSKPTLKVYLTALARYVLYGVLKFDMQLLKQKKDMSSAS
ncbi:glycosyltransferase family 2 protein [Mastigocladopsis repens]|uniref:glycosyltransferase family 2 protein n=1 Tax=Mastigocladopsis repens TaxID=221287 RepID=UPI000686D211|nr:glycosyltransferase [Mastigocladopsis repens]